MDSRTVLRTERLALRLWSNDDIEAVFGLHAQPDIARYLPGRQPWTREQAADRLHGWMMDYETHGVAKLKLVRSGSGDFVGRAGFGWMEETGEFELGYTIAPEFQGKGYATEIAAALAHSFLTSGLRDRFTAIAHVENVASLRVLEKIGMRRDRIAVFHELPCHVYVMGTGDLRG